MSHLYCYKSAYVCVYKCVRFIEFVEIMSLCLNVLQFIHMKIINLIEQIAENIKVALI